MPEELPPLEVHGEEEEPACSVCERVGDECNCVVCTGCSDRVEGVCANCSECTDCCDCATCTECENRFESVCSNCNSCDDCCDCSTCEGCGRARNSGMDQYMCSNCDRCEDGCCSCQSCEHCGERFESTCSNCDRCADHCHCVTCMGCDERVSERCGDCNRCFDCGCSCEDEDEETDVPLARPARHNGERQLICYSRGEHGVPTQNHVITQTDGAPVYCWECMTCSEHCGGNIACPSCSGLNHKVCTVCAKCALCCVCVFCKNSRHVIPDGDEVCSVCKSCVEHCTCPKCKSCRQPTDWTACQHCKQCKTCCVAEASECGAAGRKNVPIPHRDNTPCVRHSRDSTRCASCYDEAERSCSHLESQCEFCSKRQYERCIHKAKFHEAKRTELKSNSSSRMLGVEVEVNGTRQLAKGRRLWEAIELWGISVVADGSIGSQPTAFELNLQPASGDKFMNQLRDVCYGLNLMEAAPNEKCGIHVHVNARDFSQYEVKKVIELYARVERAMFDMVHPRRLNGKYSQVVKDKYKVKAANKQEFRRNLASKLYYDGQNMTRRGEAGKSVGGQITKQKADKYGVGERRYLSMSLHSWFIRGTFEFRHHEGSTDFETISGWALTCGDVINAAYRLTDRQLEALPRNPRKALLAILPERLHASVLKAWARNDAILNANGTYKMNRREIWGI